MQESLKQEIQKQGIFEELQEHIADLEEELEELKKQREFDMAQLKLQEAQRNLETKKSSSYAMQSVNKEEVKLLVLQYLQELKKSEVSPPNSSFQ